MTDLLAMERPPAINTYGYLWSHRADEAVAILASNGYREFELMLQPPHMSLDPQSAEARNLAAQVRDRSIVLHALNMPSLDQNLASAMPEMRSYTLDLFIRQIRLAGAIGARRIVVAPGRVSPLFPAPRDMLRQWLLDALAALLPVAKSEGVVLAIENLPIAALPRAADLLEFMEAIGPHPNLGICYDAANAHFVGEDPVEGIRLLRNHLQIIHFSDTGRQVWRHDMIGRGEIAFSPICKALSGIGWTGPLVLEIISPDREPLAAITGSHRALSGPEHSFGLT
ncbi:sugar phosphate isomerase/epimerase [Chelativorans composti]|uniref:Sugar phosphate isomerase/epimerase family protein n=1 Tax=Chelativorans composti TaxID=768533 RepID=A0ABW5DHS9_9HYPH